MREQKVTEPSRIREFLGENGIIVHKRVALATLKRITEYLELSPELVPSERTPDRISAIVELQNKWCGRRVRQYGVREGKGDYITPAASKSEGPVSLRVVVVWDKSTPHSSSVCNPKHLELLL